MENVFGWVDNLPYALVPLATGAAGPLPRRSGNGNRWERLRLIVSARKIVEILKSCLKHLFKKQANKNRPSSK